MAKKSLNNNGITPAGAKRRGPKKKPPRPKNRDEFMAAMDLRSAYRHDLLKEIIISYGQNPAQGDRNARKVEMMQVESSIYFLWWAFLQANREFPSPDRDPGRDTVIASTINKFGDFDLPFDEWWWGRGRTLFQENGRLPLITVADMDPEFDVRNAAQFPKYITLRIPLTIPVRGIMDQLNRIFEICHPGNALEVHRSSSAEIRIWPGREVQTKKIKQLLDVWRAVELDRRGKVDPATFKEYWRIGRDLELNGVLDVDGDDADSINNRTNLQTAVRRMYEKASHIMDNAIRGEFPRI